MHIGIHNIGPVRDAEIDFGGLTILVGPNGSGKSTVTLVSYAAANAVNYAYRGVNRASLSARPPKQGERPTETRLVKVWEDELRHAMETELRRCVHEDLQILGRHGRGGKGAAPRVYLSRTKPTPWCIPFRIDSDGLVIERRNKRYLPPELESIDPFDRASQRNSLVRSFRSGFPREAVYFPAARSGVMQTYSALTSLVFGALSRGYFQEANVGNIPGSVGDFLQLITKLKSDSHSPVGANVASMIESEVLAGEVNVGNVEGTREVTFSSAIFPDMSWPIERVATSASELSPIVLYLKHQARTEHLAFIDEPEAHLHPENQVALASGLLKMADAIGGLTVATHSEFLVSGISNELVREHIGRISGDLPKVNLYQFELVGAVREGVTVSQVEVDRAEGFEVGQFSKVADEVFDEAVELLETRSQA